MRYFPLGFRSPITGVLSPIVWKSSIVSSTPTECAIAKRCKTAFVEPPRAVITVSAFSNAFLVMISRGFISRSNNTFIASPANSHSAFFSGLSAGLDELYGRLIPKASIADAIVLAVYIPPHAPAPGQEFLTTPLKSSSEIELLNFCPSASKAETIFNFSPFHSPEWIVPPNTMIEGLFSLPMAIKEPGIFLSQPTSAIIASYHCAPITVSIESAITSRETKEYRIPEVPFDIPSLTPIVLNTSPTRSSL